MGTSGPDFVDFLSRILLFSIIVQGVDALVEKADSGYKSSWICFY